VILVTTKNGSGTKGIGIEVNSNLTFESPLVQPNFQNIYGGGNGYRTWYRDGWSGAITDPAEIAQYRAAYPQSYWPLTGTEGTDESWGAPMDGRLVRQWWSGTQVAPLTPQPNNYREFWETGRTATNNIAIAGGNDKGSFRLSVGRMDQKGIVLNNDFYRNNFKFNSNYNFTDKLSATLSAEYIKSGSDNRGFTEGQQFIWSHRHISWEQHKDWRAYEATHIQRALPGRPADTDPPNWQHTFFTNPYFIQERLPLSNEKDRIVGNVALNYTIAPFLSAMLRSGTDMWTDTRINIINFERVRNGNRTPGQYSEEVVRSQETNTDLILTFTKDISNSFSVNAMAGGLIRTNYFKRNFTRVNQLVVDGVYNLGNSVPNQNIVESRILRREAQSVFGSLQLGYRNALFLDVTGRNDWSSTLPAANRSYFYPSVAVSAVVTELLGIQSSVLSFGKVRTSWASVGNDTDPYSLNQVFTPFGSWNGSVPGYAENTPTIDGRQVTVINNSALRPERTNGIELGMDVRFLNNRIGLDVTYYNQSTFDQILRVDISRSSGYDQRVLNAGRVTNKGLEVVLNGSILKLANGLTWDATVNFARNRNQVVELAEGLDTYTLATRRGLLSLAAVGQPYGSLFGIGFERAPDGQVIYRDGLPVISGASRVLGNIQPNWTGGLQNTFGFKGISLSVLFDARMGGDVYDEGTANARWTGQYEETAVGREEGVIGAGVKNIGTADAPQYAPNDVVVAANTFYGFNNPRRFHEAAIFDASFIKLREVSLSYQLPTGLLKKMFIQTAKVSVVGRNLAILFRNHPHLDPEFDRFGGNQQGFGYGELPTTRSLGFNVSLGF
jgi:TonB-linked SusC/RagA family outer membrane protein